jgi:hypothetical protein
MNHPVIRCIAALTLILGVISGCGLFEKETPPKSQSKPISKHYSADDYIKNVALGNLSANAANASASAGNFAIVKSYHAQKKIKPEKKLMVIIEYTSGNQKTIQQIIAPVTYSGKGRDFNSLQEIMDSMDRRNITIHNVRPASATFAPDKSLKASAANAAEPAWFFTNEQKKISSRTSKLSLASEIELELDLIGFFTEHRFREAAYICVENVKQALAKATSDKTLNPQELQIFSQELEMRESTLHKELPFTL